MIEGTNFQHFKRRMDSLVPESRGLVSPSLFRHVVRRCELATSSGVEFSVAGALDCSAGRSENSSVALSHMLEEGGITSGDAAFGFRAGLTYNLEGSSPLRTLLYHSPTKAIAFKHMIDYFPAVQSDGVLRMKTEGNLLSLEYQYRDGLVVERRHLTEMMLIIVARFLEDSAPGQWSIKEFRFAHLRGNDTGEIQEIIRTPVVYAAKANAIVFLGDQLAKRRVGVEARDLSCYQEQLRKLCYGERLRHFIPTVAFEILSGIPTDESSMEHVAYRLGVSRASLFRKLANVGIQFGELVLYVRMAIARYYLERSDVFLHEIAKAAGYSEHSAFTRAFKRSFERSPSEFRRQVIVSNRSGVTHSDQLRHFHRRSVKIEERAFRG